MRDSWFWKPKPRSQMISPFWTIAADPANGLVVLADGMGGYNAGEVASGMATTVITTEMQQLLAKVHPYEVDPETNKVVAAKLVRGWLTEGRS